MKVGVIGSGPSGLTTIKQLRDEGHDVVCLEKNADIGGIWLRHPEDGDEMKVFDDMYLTISQKLMGFSDFMPEERTFLTRQGYYEYLNAYSNKYSLRESIQFGQAVESIEKTGNQWNVTATANGKRVNHQFQAMAVCSGPFRTPLTKIPHLERFSGEVIHSSRYRNNRKFRGKRVLVIGLAESGADIVRQISDVASECTLAVRSHSFLLPRILGGRYATDAYTVRAHHYEIWVRATETPFKISKAFFEDETMSRSDFMNAIRQHGMAEAMKTAATQFDLHGLAMSLGHSDPIAAVSNAVSQAALAEAAAGDKGPEPLDPMGQPMYPPKLDLYTEASQEVIDYINEWNRKSHKGTGAWAPRIILSKNVSFVPNILRGKIQVNDTGIASIEGKTVYFKDQTIKDYDCVVLCTGFEQDFSFIKGVNIEDNNVRNLYKHSFHPDDPTLALMGFVRPYSGGIPIVAEMQARYFALLCNKKIELPADVKERIQAEKAWEEHMSIYSPRHPEAIPSQIFLLDSIAKEIGCLPTCKDLMSNPELLVKLWFHTYNQSCYRLQGPHSMREAAMKSIMSEGLPGGKLTSVFLFMALSLLPSHIHPKEQDMMKLPTGGCAPF